MIVKFWIVMSVLILIGYVFHRLTKKYLNPYKLTMIFGKKGSGKSTLLTKLAMQNMERGIPVFSTTEIRGTYKLNYEDVGFYELPQGCVLLIDEVGMIWDNRNFKNFKPEVRDWFKLQRHRKITVYLFSQTFDVDKKIRDLTDEMYLVEKRLRVFSYSKKILKKIVLNKSSSESPSKLDEDLVFDSLFFFWLGSRRLTFIPKYTKYFDSYEAPQLKDKTFEKWGQTPGDDNQDNTIDVFINKQTKRIRRARCGKGGKPKRNRRIRSMIKRVFHAFHILRVRRRKGG